MSINFIAGEQISKALMETFRVYLCGNLILPQPELRWIHDEHIEVGISRYASFVADTPHLHKCATEYNYILTGMSKILFVEDDEERTVEQGSLFVVPPNTKYATKHLANIQILFWKVPGGNDKHLIDITSQLKDWIETWETTDC